MVLRSAVRRFSNRSLGLATGVNSTEETAKHTQRCWRVKGNSNAKSEAANLIVESKAEPPTATQLR